MTLGDRRWRAILGDVRGMARLKVYMDKHDGEIPPLMPSLGGGGGGGKGGGGKGGGKGKGGGSFVTRLRSLVGAREDPNIRYRILLNKRRWRDAAVQTQREFILADKASIQYANAPPGPTSLAQAAHMDDDAKHDPCVRSLAIDWWFLVLLFTRDDSLISSSCLSFL